MKQYLYTFSLIACAVSVTLPTPALGVTLYGAGSLRSSLTELAKAFTTNSGYISLILTVELVCI
jgi:hypothetical protein